VYNVIVDVLVDRLARSEGSRHIPQDALMAVSEVLAMASAYYVPCSAIDASEMPDTFLRAEKLSLATPR